MIFCLLCNIPYYSSSSIRPVPYCWSVLHMQTRLILPSTYLLKLVKTKLTPPSMTNQNQATVTRKKIKNNTHTHTHVIINIFFGDVTSLKCFSFDLVSVTILMTSTNGCYKY